MCSAPFIPEREYCSGSELKGGVIFPFGKMGVQKVQRVTSVESLGKSVRKARKSLKLTQAQLAFVAGVGSRFIVDLEAGKSTLSLEPALRVVDALGGALQLTDMPDEDEPKNAT